MKDLKQKLIVGIGLACICIGTFWYSSYQTNSKMIVANPEHINQDKLIGLVIKDRNGMRTILYGQRDGSYKNLAQIEADKNKEVSKDIKRLKELYRRK